MGVNKLRKICIGASSHFLMKITKPLAGILDIDAQVTQAQTANLSQKYKDLYGNYKILCTRINKMFLGIQCSHFVSIESFLLLCRDFSSFTANFNNYDLSGITVYVMLKGLKQNEAHVGDTNDYLVEMSIGF